MFVKHRGVLYSILLTVFTISLIISFTSVGFPYSDNKTNPRLQRFRIIHTKRTFYDGTGVMTANYNGFLLSAVDRNAVRTLESSFDPKDLDDWRKDEMCKTEIFCGFPLYRFDRGRYLKDESSGPSVKTSKFTLVKVERNPSNDLQLLIVFSVDFTTLTMIYIAPGEGWSYSKGSLQTGERNWYERSFQFSKITYGKRIMEDEKHFMVLEVNKTINFSLNMRLLSILIKI